MCSPPEINPTTPRLPPILHPPLLHRHTPDDRVLCPGNPGARLPLPWCQPRPPAKNRTRLPLDPLPHAMLSLLGPDGHAPMPLTSQHLVGETYPAAPPGRTYPQLKLLFRNRLMEECEEAAPDPAKYEYLPSLKPHPFIGHSKFDLGRLH